MSIRLVTTLCLALAAAGVGPVDAAGIGGKYSGRYQCGDWNTVDLAITEEGAGKLSAEFTFALPQGRGTGSYSMTGQYDERADTFLLVPQRWTRRPPPGYQMVGMEGRYDPATKRLTGKIGNLACRGFELAGEGGAPLSALPSGSAVTPGQVANPSLQVQPTVQGVEYWDASMADDGSGKRVLREAEPIDDVIDWLKRSKYSCVGSRRLTWNSEGTRATTTQDRVDTRETYVIECDGDCRGLRYVPMTDAIVYNFGRGRPVPVLQMRNTRGSGAILQWVFTREPGGPPPEIHVHHWNAHSFNRSSGCKAPKSNNK